MDQRRMRQEIQELLRFFGRAITRPHARQLSKLRIEAKTLQKWKAECSTPSEFEDMLKRRKVNSKTLRRNLCNFFK